MQILPKTLGTRPRLAVELRAEGVVAAKAEDAAAQLATIAQSPLADGAVSAGLKAGNIADPARVTAAIRETLDAVAGRSGDRGREVTIVVPDAAVRVLLLEFDELPGKAVEALPVIRFRLKKLLPFDADPAAVSYQVMASERGMVKVLAAAMPREVLEEYEEVIAAAGYASGAVLPSTLAALGGLDEQEAPALVVNCNRGSVTTAIVRGGVLMLHRTVEMAGEAIPHAGRSVGLLAQDGPRVYGRDGYDRIEAQAAIETQVMESNEAAMAAREIAQSVSVAGAYFEDTLGKAPEMIVSAGTLGAEGLRALLEESGLEGLRVQEMVGADALSAGATTRVPRGWLAGVRGALRN
jgi:type IV pilus assembly protein PilM